MFDSVKYIFFDLDHTLWDFEINSRIALKNLFNHYYEYFLPYEDSFEEFLKVYHVHNLNAWIAYEKGEIDVKVLKKIRFENTLKELGIETKYAEEFDAWYLNNLAEQKNVNKNVLEILYYLKINYQMGIISNGFEKIQYKKLKSSGIYDYFEHIITSDMINISKPNPKIFDYASNECGYKPQEILYIGDNYKADYLGALNYGMKSILYDPHDNFVKSDIIRISDFIELKKSL